MSLSPEIPRLDRQLCQVLDCGAEATSTMRSMRDGSSYAFCAQHMRCEHLNRVQAAEPIPGLRPLPGKCLDCGETVPHTDCIEAFDEIDRPRHYNSGKIECWDYIVDQDMGYLDGCVVKYVTRYRRKGTPLKDLRKARAYLDRLIALVEKDDTAHGG